MPWVYILRCGDNTFYVGHTHNLKARVWQHQIGIGASYTSRRLPIDLVYSEGCESLNEAIKREHQLKGWSAEKKAALIAHDLVTLKSLSRSRRPKPTRE